MVQHFQFACESPNGFQQKQTHPEKTEDERAPYWLAGVVQGSDTPTFTSAVRYERHGWTVWMDSAVDVADHSLYKERVILADILEITAGSDKL